MLKLKHQHIIGYGQLKSSLIISTQNLWASDLSELLSDVSVITLKNYFPDYKVFAFPAPQHIYVDYRIAIRIRELAGQIGGQSHLQAQWLVKDAENILQLNRSKKFVRQS